MSWSNRHSLHNVCCQWNGVFVDIWVVEMRTLKWLIYERLAGQFSLKMQSMSDACSFIYLFIYSFIPETDIAPLHSSRHYYSEALPAQSRPKKKDIVEFLRHVWNIYLLYDTLEIGWHAVLNSEENNYCFLCPGPHHHLVLVSVLDLTTWSWSHSSNLYWRLKTSKPRQLSSKTETKTKWWGPRLIL